MFDATKLPTEPCDPNKVANAPANVKTIDPGPRYARAPAGNGHEVALKKRSGQQ